MKGSVLELGGKDPMIVCADANLANAISGCLWGGFANAGPDLLRASSASTWCDDVADRFIEGVVEGAQALRVGDPMTATTEIGPMVSREQFDSSASWSTTPSPTAPTLRCGGPVDVAGHPAAASTRRPC